MSSFDQRLSKLEPAPEHWDYLQEVALRLMCYGVETRHQVKAGKLEEFAWGADQERIYQRWTQDPAFAAQEREILENLAKVGSTIAR